MRQTISNKDIIDTNAFKNLKEWSDYQDSRSVKSENNYDKLFNEIFVLTDFNYQNNN